VYARTCQICAYYRPHPDDDISLEPLSQSLSRINPSSKSVIIVGGDVNLGLFLKKLYILYKQCHGQQWEAMFLLYLLLLGNLLK
jgi:hypothetical protein